ncbi:hypothetical protein KGQ34_04145 [Patescibacteria group bacterium]|nr:hypothetical protein [Patescibacteria group bacterium]
MNKKVLTHIVISAALALTLPLITLAAGDLNATITNFIGYAKAIINFLLVIATLVFIWGIVKYITAGGDAAKITEARSYIIWGLIGLAVMASVWALTYYIIDISLVGNNNTIPVNIYK